MHDDKRLTDDELEAVFEAAARTRPEPDARWLARVARDAQDTAQGGRARAAPPSFWAQLRDGIGGWRGLSGMAMASATGLWIGFAPPAILGDPVAAAFPGDRAVELVTGGAFDYELALEEG